MKKLFYLFCIVSLVFITITSCKKTEFQLRVENSLSEKIDYVNVGSAHFNSISAGSFSTYRTMPEGTHHVDGQTTSGISIYGTVTLSSTSDYTGMHQFTLEIYSGGVSLFEE